MNARIGLRTWEAKPQPLMVRAELYAAPDYLKTVTEKNIIDYERIYKAVTGWRGRAHVNLVETYVYELLDLAFAFNAVKAARVSIRKEKIFKDCAGPGVEVFMTRADYKKFQGRRS